MKNSQEATAEKIVDEIEKLWSNDLRVGNDIAYSLWYDRESGKLDYLGENESPIGVPSMVKVYSNGTHDAVNPFESGCQDADWEDSPEGRWLCKNENFERVRHLDEDEIAERLKDGWVQGDNIFSLVGDQREQFLEEVLKNLRGD